MFMKRTSLIVPDNLRVGPRGDAEFRGLECRALVAGAGWISLMESWEVATVEPRSKRKRTRRDVPIALLTDFGYTDHYAGVLRGVIASISPGARVVDITHGIAPQNIAAGALALRESWRVARSRP